MKVLKFKSVAGYKPGIILSLLSRSYANLWNDDLKKKFTQFDQEVFENPDTVGACAFIACLDNEVIGFASYDPRQGPEVAIIGHNCILPKFQGRGYGKQQVFEILRRLKTKGFKKAIASTGEHPFFKPAQMMYQTCGFRETKRYNDGGDPRYGSIGYEIVLS